MAQFSIHGIKSIRAETKHMSGGFKLSFTDAFHWHGDSEVLVFSDDAVLSERIATAINRIVENRAAELAATSFAVRDDNEQEVA